MKEEKKEEKIFDLHVDAYSPKEMAERVEKIGVAKARLEFWNMFLLALMAGAFIGLGAEFYISVVHDSPLSLGLTGLIGGIVFSLGLILVIVAGAELFTGNTLIVMAFVQRKISFVELLRNWFIVYVGNFLGALAMVLMMYLARRYAVNDGLVGATAVMIANNKINLGFDVAFMRGILCNILVSLAVWLTISGRYVVDKILAILFPITAFVALGFEHCVANMYFIPMGLLLKLHPQIISLAEKVEGISVDSSVFNESGFLFSNLLPVTLGNVVGGAVFVGIIYWFVYLRYPVEINRTYPLVSKLPFQEAARKPSGLMARRNNEGE